LRGFGLGFGSGFLLAVETEWKLLYYSSLPNGEEKLLAKFTITTEKGEW
jgi:hypothetical protein